MTWAEFKARVESLGVLDDDNIFYIDVEGTQLDPTDVDVIPTTGGWGIG